MRFWIDRHGCAKNDVDGEEIAARLEAAGHEFVDGPGDADLVIVNTCGFIEDAKKESIEAVVAAQGRLSRQARPRRRLPRPALRGRARRRPPRGRRHRRQRRPRRRARGGRGHPRRRAAGPRARGGALHRQRPTGPPLRLPRLAHVKATEGCSNFCSFCAIPLIRGRLRSRPVDEVLAECLDLVAQGVKELVLIGQDLGSYGRDFSAAVGGAEAASRLPELLAAISASDGDFRVRTLYIHPDNFPEGILPLIAADRRLVPYFDLPFQHASGRLLKAMNRRGGAAAYLDLIGRIRARLPDAAIRSTFLIGFPGETEEDFAELRDFQERARLDWVGSFAYSREEGTAAYGMPARVAKKTVAARRRLLEEAQERITREALERFVGRELEILVEENVAPSRRGARKSSRWAEPGTRRPRWTGSPFFEAATSRAR